MAVLIGHASIDENGTIQGKKDGDQTGKEVCTRNWYNKPWGALLRPLSTDIAEKSAKACEAACANPAYGYSQPKRNTGHTEAKKVGYKIEDVTKPCGTDCSALMTLCAIAGGVSELEYTGNAPTTSTMCNAFVKTGKYEKLTDKKYLTSDEYLQRGDILVSPGSHTVMVLSNGDKAKPRKDTLLDKVADKIKQATKYPRRGVDVSKSQQNLDYKKIKDAGCEFAIIKVIDKTNQAEPMFETHYKGFTDVGVPVDFYTYVYSTTVEAANVASMAIIKVLNGRKGVVYIDLENDCLKGLKERLPQIVNAYKEKLEAAGLQVALYSGMYFLKETLMPYVDVVDVRKLWCARYYNSYATMYIDSPLDESKKPSVPGFDLIGWQYTSSGKIDGCNGRIDMDIMYKPVDNESYSNSSPIKVGYVDCNSLRVRDMPNTNGRIIGYVTSGQKLIIYEIDKQTGWYRIHPKESQWVSNKYIKIS